MAFAIKDLPRRITTVLSSGTGVSPRPLIRNNNESNVKGLYLIGDLAGAPVIKLAMEQGYQVIEHIASLPDAQGNDPDVLDVLICGAGAAGLNAALQARDCGLSHLILEKGKIANTIENFPEGKWIYAEPDEVPSKGKLWLDGAKKEDLVGRWHQIIGENGLNINVEEGVASIEKRDALFHLTSDKGTVYKAQRVIIAIGIRGNPRKLNVPGEEREEVYHRLYSPRLYKNEDILVVGGGNSAIEAALTLSEQNRVVLSYRGDAFYRIFKDNERLLNEAINQDRIRVIPNSNVTRFGDGQATLLIKDDSGQREEAILYNHVFVLAGAELPVKLLKSFGIRMENEWEGNPLLNTGLVAGTFFALWAFGKGHVPEPSVNPAVSALFGLVALALVVTLIIRGGRGDRYSWLGLSFIICYTVYGAKKSPELWPYTEWGAGFLSFFGRPWAFWYTVLYTALMTIFGIEAMKRWGFDRKDKFQILRFCSLISFQWFFFFIVPEFLFQWAVEYEWLGEISRDPQFSSAAWRSYGLVYAWPLFFYTFFYDPHKIWVIWGVFLTFILIPALALFHGKRFCSWICGCGGLAETLGDRWRHLAPKGKTATRWQSMNLIVLAVAVIITVVVVGTDLLKITGFFGETARSSISWYGLIVDTWLVGILPVTLYPFLGGKVWCRFWCPLAKLMEMVSRFKGKFKIRANSKCIACGECTRYCQVGIDVMSFALKQEELSNKNSSCIGCGICVTACPMDVLSFGNTEKKQLLQISQ